MTLTDAGIFFGRFHPLLVHLPIGFLLMAVILAILGWGKKYQAIQPAISFALLAGAICAALACVTGYILSFSGDYNEEILAPHMWGGLSTAAISAVAYLLSRRQARFANKSKALMITMFVMVISISITGHMGGTLTHGAGYISSDLLFGSQKAKKQITNIDDAVIYEDLVQPILAKKCSNCHNSSKKKGELSMESYTTLLKGGKHGVVVDAGHANKSELLKRVMLDPKDEKFMPSDRKPPLNDEEKNILTWWIEKAGASKEKKIKETGATAAIKKDINNYLGLQVSTIADSDENILDSADNYFAKLAVPVVTEQQVNKLKQHGFAIKYIHLKPVLLDVTLPENKNETQTGLATKFKELVSVKDNVIWLNVAGNNISDSQLVIISQFRNLQRLRLNKNPVTDIGISKLKTLANLESINLYNTKISSQSITSLSSLKKLKHIYVWGSNIKDEDLSVVKDSTLKIVRGFN